MRTTILAVGRIKAPFTEAEAHYRKLISRYQPIEISEARDDAGMARRIPVRGASVVALDREGRELDSLEWSGWLQERRVEARDLVFLIGGPEGLAAEALGAATQRLSLGRETMAHQLARVVLLEQLYRASKIIANEPYHL